MLPCALPGTVKMPSGGGGTWLTATASALVTLVCCASALDTGIEAATLCCGTDCVDLAQEFPDAWRARNDLRTKAQTFPRVRPACI